MHHLRSASEKIARKEGGQGKDQRATRGRSVVELNIVNSPDLPPQHLLQPLERSFGLFHLIPLFASPSPVLAVARQVLQAARLVVLPETSPPSRCSYLVHIGVGFDRNGDSLSLNQPTRERLFLALDRKQLNIFTLDDLDGADKLRYELGSLGGGFRGFGGKRLGWW